MIKEVLEKKVNDNFGNIVDEIAIYFGLEYCEEINKKAQNIEILIAKDNGVVQIGNSQFYIGDEPVCIKDDPKHVLIVLPVSSLCSQSGNVSFVHAMLHALTREIFIKEGNDAFNETIVDYMANEISKRLEYKGINMTMTNNPVYESNSFYSRMFLKIDDFYRENRDKIIGNMMGKNFEIENVDEYIRYAQDIVDKVFLESGSKEESVIKRR